MKRHGPKDDPYLQLSPELASELVLEAMQNIRAWALPSAEAYRNAVINGAGLMVNPVLDLHEFDEINRFLSLLVGTIEIGRMVDFGTVENEVIREISTTARPAFEAGELIHPFPSWVAVSRWEGGLNGYLVLHNPFLAGHALILETYGLRMPPRGPLMATDVILVYDVVQVKVEKVGSTVVVPFPHQAEMTGFMTEAQQIARGANSLDPMVCFLRLLADASVPVTPVQASEKLNKARAKSGKPPIPPHTRVDVSGYVTALRAHAAGVRRGTGEGTHASPIAHWRRAHKRRLASGIEVPVRSSRVNWRTDEDLKRVFYQVDLRNRAKAAAEPAGGVFNAAGTSTPWRTR